MNMKKNYIAVLAVSLLVSTVLSGCGNSTVGVNTTEMEPTNEPTQILSEQEPAPTETVEVTTEPIVEEENQTLSERVGGKLYVGDEFTFGTYEQDNDLENGAEDIEWIVLEKTGEDTYLCISKYVLDARRFSDAERYYEVNGSSYTVFNDWGISAIRTWLNDDFFNTAFTSEDQESITDTTNRVYVWQQSGDDLTSASYTDKVCLINYGYLGEYPECVKATEYAVAQGAPVIDDGTREHENCSNGWWMMSLDVDGARMCIENHRKFVEDYNANPSHWWTWEDIDKDCGDYCCNHHGYPAVGGGLGTTAAILAYGHNGNCYEEPNEVCGVRPVISITLGNS